MAVTQSPRLGITEWSDSAVDPFTRAQLEHDHEQLEALVPVALQGAFADRPAAGVDRRYYMVTAAGDAHLGELYYDDGAVWRIVNPPSALVFGAGADIDLSLPGDNGAAGATGRVADAGHQHGREAWGVGGDVTTAQPGSVPAAGGTGRVADAAHQHGGRTPFAELFLHGGR